MFINKMLKLLLFFVSSQLIAAGDVFAWGPAVHTVTVLSALSGAASLLPSIAGTITAFPREFLYGCLAADFFIGKGLMSHSKHPHNWKGGFFFLKEAANSQELSFSYGFLSHLAADVVAHNFLVPKATKIFPNTAWARHIYCELRADFLVGPLYTSVARDILSMDNRQCDEMMKAISLKRGHRLSARKGLFRQSVQFSEYFHATRGLFFNGKSDNPGAMDRYLLTMIEMSCSMVKDLLKSPYSSDCLKYNPSGARDLLQAGKKNALRRWLGNIRDNRASKN
jgi:hypothetical protein